MEKTLLASVAVAAMAMATPAPAADLPARMPVKAPPMVAPVPVFTWTGFYLGGDIGYLGGHTRIEEAETGALIALGPTNGALGGLLCGGHWPSGPPCMSGAAGIRRPKP